MNTNKKSEIGDRSKKSPSPSNKKKPKNKLGAELREAREKKGYSYEDIFEELKIRPIFTKAMEEGNYHILPSGVYTKTYLKTYADYLGLDGHKFLVELANEAENDNEPDQKPVQYKNYFSPSNVTIIASIVFTLVIYGVWSYYAKEKNADINIEVDKHIQKVLSSYGSATHEVVLLAIGDTSTQISDANGEIIFSANMKKGETYFMPKNKNSLGLIVSDIENIEIYIDGNIVQSPEFAIPSEGDDKYSMILDVERLLALSDIQ